MVRNRLKLLREHILEILDFGYPQNTDPGVLKAFITQQGVRTAVSIFRLSLPFYQIYNEILLIRL